MSINYFKLRSRSDFSKDTLDIGNPITWKRSHFLKHLFKRIFTLPENRLKEFYDHHLDYYLVNNINGSRKLFFRNLWDLIERQLKVLVGRDIYGENHIRTQKELEHLKKFTAMLIALDQWNIHKSNDEVISHQESEILALICLVSRGFIPVDLVTFVYSVVDICTLFLRKGYRNLLRDSIKGLMWSDFFGLDAKSRPF